ncbi:MAG: hypothetical protein ABR538_13630 [Candidatus Binatia bacterium]
MPFGIRNLLHHRVRPLAAAFCLVVASLQLVLPVLHGAHGEHLASNAVLDSGSGSLRVPALPTSDAASTHEGAMCLQCRLVSQSGSPTVTTTSTGIPDLRESRVHEVPVDISITESAAADAPPRAPPLAA